MPAGECIGVIPLPHPHQSRIIVRCPANTAPPRGAAHGRLSDDGLHPLAALVNHVAVGILDQLLD